jgi:hypothetical protein
LTRIFAEEFNSISARFGAYATLATKKMNPEVEHKLFQANYYRPNWKQLSERFRSNKLTINIGDIKEWIARHRYPKFVGATLEKHFEAGWERCNINAVEVHAKVEQTTKLDKLSRWYDEVISRSIVAGSYAISAMFGALFIKVKKRLKEILNDNIIYADGLTPDQLAASMRQWTNVKNLVEDDLTKQDRQTSHGMVAVERLIYLDLGIDEVCLDFYLLCHTDWNWKGHGTRGRWDAMRLSGQVTTAIGNLIVNLVVHNRLFAKNRHLIVAMYALGDDNIMFSSGEVDVTGHGTVTKKIYNMISKVKSNPNVGVFLSMLVHNLGGELRVCPYFQRLRHCYSVCNYTYTANDMAEKIGSRTLSYAFMLGGISRSKSMAKKLCPSAEIPSWYDVPSAVEANALYDQSSAPMVENHIGVLLNMMENHTSARRIAFQHWSEKPPQR